jgi:hypothetical protein
MKETDYSPIKNFEKMKKIFSRIMMLATMMAAMTGLTSCEDEDDYIAQQLREGDWQGVIGAYYNDRWGISGSTYATVMRFESRGSYYTSGRGYELNYNTRSPHQDYACSSFKWFIVDKEITLLYDDDVWTPIYIIDYRLYSDRFYGNIYTPTNRSIKFDFENMVYEDWDYYRSGSGRYGNYGDFHDQRYFRSRTTQAMDEEVPFIDRSSIAREKSGEAGAVSVASGEFARAMQEAATKAEAAK